MWSHWVDFNRGLEDGRLNFSEAQELLEFLSGSPAPDGLELSKHVYMGGGWPTDARATRIVTSVKAWASALPFLLASPSTKWGALLISLEARRRSPGPAASGRSGVVAGAVHVLILSTSKVDSDAWDL
jgi:hypothetical protein